MRSLSVRNTTEADDADLARLLDSSYDGSIDADPEADHGAEIATWRSVDHANDAASFVATDASGLVGASLIGRELEAPIIYEIAVDPRARRAGTARALLQRSLTELRDEPIVAGWVTVGNEPSERLLASVGFWPSTGPLQRDDALTIYRAASALRRIDRPPGALIWAGGPVSDPELWLIHDDGPTETIESNGVAVSVHRAHPSDERLRMAATRTTPLDGAVLHRDLAEVQTA